METHMAAIARPQTTPTPIHVPWLAWAAATIGLFVIYLMLQENGLLLANNWETLHELFHDGRHALGMPCH
jgi:hypothetical protein